jgi:hypothetical protein
MEALRMSNNVKITSQAKEVFSSASPENQGLIKEILREERDVQHLQRRSDIHARIYDHIRRLIK